jgi:hypothetical protein
MEKPGLSLRLTCPTLQATLGDFMQGKSVALLHHGAELKLSMYPWFS